MNKEKVSKLARDLTKQAPRSPFTKLGGYSILPRAIDKCRAHLLVKNGEYNFDCPMDNSLFSFKNIKGKDFQEYAATGASDEELLQWFNDHGDKKSEKEIKEWSHKVDNQYYAKIPEKAGWFNGECKRLGLDPEKTTLFQYLDVDDNVSFKK